MNKKRAIATGKGEKTQYKAFTNAQQAAYDARQISVDDMRKLKLNKDLTDAVENKTKKIHANRNTINDLLEAIATPSGEATTRLASIRSEITDLIDNAADVRTAIENSLDDKTETLALYQTIRDL